MNESESPTEYWRRKAALLFLRDPTVGNWMCGLGSYSSGHGNLSDNACILTGVEITNENKGALTMACEEYVGIQIRSRYRHG